MARFCSSYAFATVVLRFIQGTQTGRSGWVRTWVSIANGSCISFRQSLVPFALLSEEFSVAILVSSVLAAAIPHLAENVRGFHLLIGALVRRNLGQLFASQG